MKTNSLLKLSLVVAILAILVIVLLANNLEPKTITISAINERMLDEWVKISGKVVDERTFENLKILTIDDGNATINAILREKENSSFLYQHVIILGKVIEYKNELEIEISRIEIL